MSLMEVYLIQPRVVGERAAWTAESGGKILLKFNNNNNQNETLGGKKRKHPKAAVNFKEENVL